ncbi:MAG TPA: hypothetical protein VNK51_05535 [Bradyrhizobium sp.]|nr:hypothetical protein [Bradyrhizobium sp.]
MSLVDLESLAKRARIEVKVAGKYALVDALLPHVEAGTVSVEGWTPFTLPNPQFPNAAEKE